MSSEKQTVVLGIPFRENVTKTNVVILFAMSFIGMFLNMLPVALQPLYLQEVIGISRQHLGKINASLSVIVEIMIILLVGAIGVFSDKVGRKKLLVTGLIFGGTFIVCFGSSHIVAEKLGIEQQLIPVYVFRTLIGFSLLFVWPQVQSLITDYTYTTGRGKAMALMGFMFVLAALFINSFVVRLPKSIGLQPVFLLTFAIGIVASIVSMFGLVDIIEVKKKEKVAWQQIFGIVKNSPCLRITFSAAFASRADVIILGMFTMVWVIKVAKEFGRTPMQAMAEGGLTIAMASIIGLLCYPAWGYLVEKWGRLKILILGLTLAGSGFMLLFFVNNPFSIWMKLCIIIFALGVNGAGVGASTLTSDIAPRNLIGSLLGGYHTAAALGIMFFLQAGGFLFDHMGHSMPYVLNGAANLLVVIYALITWKKASAEEKEYLAKKYH